MQGNVTELLVEAATLMVVGMSVVFAFLVLLIGAMRLISAVNTLLPAEQEDVRHVPRSRSATQSTSSAGLSSATVAAIGAAIHQYRKTK